MKIKSYKEQIVKDKLLIDALRKDTIEQADPLIVYGDIPILEANAITIIQGKAGAAKSRLAQLICSHMIMKSGKESEFEFHKIHSRPIHLCYADTERNIKSQCPRAFQSIIQVGGYRRDESIPSLDFITLLRISRQDRFNALKEWIEEMRKEHADKHIVIVLDVVTDCVDNFNDAQGSLELIDHMNNLINETEVSFLAIIHENPGSDKARGHLGTELMNKSSTQIQVGYAKDRSGMNSDILEVNILKNRNAGKFTPMYLKIDSYGMLSKLKDEETQNLKALKEDKAAIHEIVSDLEAVVYPISNKDLKENLMKKHKVSDRTIEKRLEEVRIREYKVKQNGVYHILINGIPNGKRGKQWDIEKV